MQLQYSKMILDVLVSGQIKVPCRALQNTAGALSYIARERTGMQRATLGKSGSKGAPWLQGRIARAFSSNSLVNTMEMRAVI